MADQKLKSIIKFLQDAEQLKDTLRSAHTTEGRQESTAEHSWRLCLMVLLFEEDYADLDILKLMKICLIHDLGEAVNGDIAAVDQVGAADKNDEERKDLYSLTSSLPEGPQHKIMALWDEYDQGSSPEARLAKAFDKLETILQHNQGNNPADFDYGFNLTYGKKHTDLDHLTMKMRQLVDQDTQRRGGQQKEDRL